MKKSGSSIDKFDLSKASVTAPGTVPMEKFSTAGPSMKFMGVSLAFGVDPGLGISDDLQRFSCTSNLQNNCFITLPSLCMSKCWRI